MASARTNRQAGNNNSNTNEDGQPAGAGQGDLRNALARARKQEIHFGFVLGKGTNQLSAGKKPVKGSAMKELQETAGGGKKLKGTCQFIDGELVLTLEKGKAPSGADKQLRKLIKEQTGFSWKVRIQEAGEGNEGEEEEDQNA